MDNNNYNLGLAFTAIAKKNAKFTALCYSEHSINYMELSDWADHLGVLLLSHGICRGDVIAIGNNKRDLSYALMIAALRLGITYVNIDVTMPFSRNLYVLSISKTALLFYDDSRYSQEMEELANELQCPIIELSPNILPTISPTDRAHLKQLMLGVDSACIAYIMFTSGSTGKPKGVAVTHQNLLYFISWGQNYFTITNKDNFANLSPMYFDNSVFDFYVALFSGASVSPIYRELLTRPYELVAHIAKMKCTVWFSVPSLLIYLMTMKAMTNTALPRLKHIVFGGEGYHKIELKKLYNLFSPQAKLINVYGPTECTCICSAYILNDQDFEDMEGLPPLGKLNPNFDYRILNEQEQDASNGELCLIGPNVAAGYFNDVERTARSFFTLHEPTRFMKRMYRTGDLVHKTEKGLHFIGRIDNQIKHMGYRIELEEIEYALVKFPYINQAAVIYQRSNNTHGKLIGFVASSIEIDEIKLLTGLAKLLPDYMIPSRIIVKQELPKNPNGKVDRQQLAVQEIA